MKLKNKLSLITAVAMLTFCGVGYAAWTFTNIENAQVATIEDKVAVGIELNDGFKLYNADDDAEVTALYLICDAPSNKDYVLAGNGVYWATDAAGTNAITNVYIKGSLTKNMEDNIKDKTSVTVQFTATHNLGENDYVTFGAMTSSANKVINNLNEAGVFDVQSVDFTLPAVAYSATEENIPHNITELTTMNTILGTALSGKTLSFTAQIIA